MSRWRVAGVVGALSVLTAWGCGDKTPTAASEETFPQKREAYSGTVNPGELAAFHFAVENPGQLEVYIASLGAGTSLAMGLRMGFWDELSGICQEQIYSDAAQVGQILSGEPQGPGEYCVAIYDVGNLQEATDFGLAVIHY